MSRYHFSSLWILAPAKGPPRQLRTGAADLKISTWLLTTCLGFFQWRGFHLFGQGITSSNINWRTAVPWPRSALTGLTKLAEVTLYRKIFELH